MPQKYTKLGQNDLLRHFWSTTASVTPYVLRHEHVFVFLNSTKKVMELDLTFFWNNLLSQREPS